MNLLKRWQRGKRIRAWLVAAALAVAATGAQAVPYASGIKFEGGVLTFILNEDADNVKVIAGATVHDLGALTKGTVSRTLALSGAFRIEVRRSAPGGWAQTSSDANTLVRFNSPRGVAVNNHPASPYFGRVYIANSAAGTAGGRSVGDGIYVLNADQSDALGQGDTALTGGADFALGGAAAPYRVTVGEDGNLYICDWSDAAGNLIVTDPSVTAGSAQFVLKPLASTTAPGNATTPVGLDNTHGSIAAAVVKGSLAQGNLTLFVIDEDLQTDKESTGLTELNGLWRFDIGAGPLPSTVDSSGLISLPSITFVSQTMDLAMGPNGYCYVTDRRSAGAQNGLQVVDPSDPDPFTRVKFNSLDESMNLGNATDFLFEAGSVDVSVDGKWLAVYRYGNNEVVVMPLTDGIPDLAKRVVFPAFGTTAAGRDIAFDAAGNLHIVSSGFGLYRVFSPGGTTVATTTSEGQFTVSSPSATVSVTASVPETGEGGGAPGEFTLTREGSTVGALAVTVSLSGEAENGADFTTLSTTVTIPDGQTSVTVPVAAIDDAVPEVAERVILTIQGSDLYTAGSPGTATVTIADNETPQISLSTVYASAYERVAADYILFRANRLGDLGPEVTVNVAYSGAGAAGASGPATVAVAAGEAGANFQVHPVDNGALDGDREVVATVTAGAGYTIGTAAATGTIIDDELPSEVGKVLFTDSFDTDTAGAWTLRKGMGNGVDDYTVAFAYDYVNGDGIPPAPNGSGLGLKMTVNKLEATALGAAGVNVYPNGQTFSGDFAVRFHMYLLMNGGAGTTEHALVGINHSGSKANWVRQSAGVIVNPPVDNDGVYAAIVADGSLVNGLGHVIYRGDGALNPALQVANVDPLDLTAFFKSPPYLGTTGLSGAPANTVLSETGTWVDVELRQVGTTVTLLVNKTPIVTYNNSSGFTAGNIMLGYNDQFDSIGDAGAVYVDNLRVVRLDTPVPTTPSITSIAVSGGVVTIEFTGGASDGPGAFQVAGKAAVEGTFAVEAGAQITQLNPGQFRATVAASGDVRFYQIRR